jgi:aspartokinase-like uncharacterized kinase
MIETVIKIGGSLARGDGLPRLGQQLAGQARRQPLLVIPGGGDFADMVRAYDRRFHMHASAAHWMAVLAMDQYGHLLAGCIPDSVPVRSLATAKNVAQGGQTPVLLPFDLLRRADPLPHSWDVTSDSLAAWVAVTAGAARLVLLKDVDGLYPETPHQDATQPPLKTVTLAQLASCRGVDSYLAVFLKTHQLALWVINGEVPERLTELLTQGQTVGSHYWPSAS